MKLMAIDYGKRRIGIASTDDSGKFALPRMVIENDRDAIEKIIDFKNENNIDSIIIGESKNLSGAANPILRDILQFKSELEKKEIKVILHSEIYTTQEAARIQGRGKQIDASAAALILKHYVDTVYNK